MTSGVHLETSRPNDRNLVAVAHAPTVKLKGNDSGKMKKLEKKERNDVSGLLIAGTSSRHVIS